MNKATAETYFELKAFNGRASFLLRIENLLIWIDTWGGGGGESHVQIQIPEKCVKE